jgi:hypothetical protein
MILSSTFPLQSLRLGSDRLDMREQTVWKIHAGLSTTHNGSNAGGLRPATRRQFEVRSAAFVLPSSGPRSPWHREANGHLGDLLQPSNRAENLKGSEKQKISACVIRAGLEQMDPLEAPAPRDCKCLHCQPASQPVNQPASQRASRLGRCCSRIGRFTSRKSRRSSSRLPSSSYHHWC